MCQGWWWWCECVNSFQLKSLVCGVCGETLDLTIHYITLIGVLSYFHRQHVRTEILTINTMFKCILGRLLTIQIQCSYQHWPPWNIFKVSAVAWAWCLQEAFVLALNYILCPHCESGQQERHGSEFWRVSNTHVHNSLNSFEIQFGKLFIQQKLLISYDMTLLLPAYSRQIFHTTSRNYFTQNYLKTTKNNETARQQAN